LPRKTKSYHHLNRSALLDKEFLIGRVFVSFCLGFCGGSCYCLLCLFHDFI
jgi:hypothetical protein